MPLTIDNGSLDNKQSVLTMWVCLISDYRRERSETPKVINTVKQQEFI